MLKIKGIDCFPSRGAAEILQIGRNIMMRELRTKGVLGKNNLPTSNYREHFVVTAVNKNGFIIQTAYLTSEGLDYVKDLLKDLPRKKTRVFKEEIRPLPQDLLDSF